MSDFTVVLFFACAAVTALYFYAFSMPAEGSKRALLKLPLIGDLHDSPTEKPLLNWSKWSRERGPITVPKIFGVVPIVVLNTHEAATELFSRRSQWYSNRPSSVTMEMITGSLSGQSKFTLMQIMMITSSFTTGCFHPA